MRAAPGMGSHPRRRRRRVLGRSLGAVAITPLLAAGAFSLSPIPAALIIRALFDRDARAVTAALAKDAPPAVVTADVAYRDEDPDARLDVHVPPDTTSALPTIVWAHGGAWLSGGRKDYAGYYARLAGAGFTVVSVGYSIAPGARYPTAIHQLNDAHAYLLAHAAELHVDPRRVLLAGDSAGAQLSAQLASAITSPEVALDLGLQPALPSASLRGVVLNCGIYDIPVMAGANGLVGWALKRVLWAYTGASDFAASTAARQMSTLRLVTGSFPPTYISAGNADPLTAMQSRPLAARLRELGVEVDALFYPDTHPQELAHEYQFDLSLADSRTALERTIAFARRVTRD